ncbi:hypothetical protein [Nostoc sp.]|uniref:hypothetical protein n=1 Tax=Nostoc sp. TaxID=1180 RepID=UPI002FF568F1
MVRQLRTLANRKRAAVKAIHSRLVLTSMAAAINERRSQILGRGRSPFLVNI